jgi:quercetin dioxygenase-like cupin family protein
MPDNLLDQDAVLYIEDKSGKEHYILPNEGDMVIMEANVPHAPEGALNSTKDRIVLTANVGFHTEKSLKTLF